MLSTVPDKKPLRNLKELLNEDFPHFSFLHDPRLYSWISRLRAVIYDTLNASTWLHVKF
jgi:hypothetical protein